MRKEPKTAGIIILSFLIILSLFGIIQIATIAEEVFHVIHGKGAKSICLDFNMKINDSVQKGYMSAHTVFDVEKHYENITEFYTWREMSERIAGFFRPVLMICMAFIIGVSSNIIFKHFQKN